ncbi:hypothetical protein [Actinocatenispora rupis]|uniref:Uncharacterized protein n=1 Tax=Actinocatenispora rupis TaxID=519421 RepID=A0A8J3JCQ4_9ACTN|nr:hypothetical protein [Actinocatenispora rupis]GID15985.1 hypothetical protein Aru02nite_68740 [Actinocatenispora rupis]
MADPNGFRDRIEAAVATGAPLTADDGVALLGHDDLSWLGGLAHRVRGARSGVVTTFVPTADPATLPGVTTWAYAAGQAPADRVAALLALRGQVVVPVRTDPDDLDHTASPAEMLKLFAVARLLLPADTVLGVDLATHPESTAQLLLDFGAADLLVPADGFDADHWAELIWDAGGTPVQRDEAYGTVRDFGPAHTQAERRAEPQSVFS